MKAVDIWPAAGYRVRARGQHTCEAVQRGSCPPIKAQSAAEADQAADDAFEEALAVLYRRWERMGCRYQR